MSQQLFSLPKVGLFLDSYAPALEKRRGGEEVKVLVLTLRMQPFDAKWATSVDDGLGDGSGVKMELFSLNTAEPKPHVSRVNFVLGCPRQNLRIYASPDTAKSRLALLQCKISSIYVRKQKDINGFAFVFKASVGPVGREEQEFIHAWMLTQRFVSFEESEPSMEFSDAGEDDDVEDATGAKTSDGQAGLYAKGPAPEWDEKGEAADAPPSGETEQEHARPPRKRNREKPRGKRDPETHRSAQVKEAKVKQAKRRTH